MNISAVLNGVDWDEIFQTEDADYKLRFLDSTYASFIPMLAEVALDETENWEKRGWAAEAIDAIDRTHPDLSQIWECFSRSREFGLRSARFWVRIGHFMNDPRSFRLKK